MPSPQECDFPKLQKHFPPQLCFQCLAVLKSMKCQHRKVPSYPQFGLGLSAPDDQVPQVVPSNGYHFMVRSEARHMTVEVRIKKCSLLVDHSQHQSPTDDFQEIFSSGWRYPES